MTGTAGRSRRQRCITCRPSEWRAIKAKARAEGVDVSAFILSRVLDGEAPDGPPDPEAGYPMALTGDEQREQFETLQRCVAGCGPLMRAPFIPGHAMTISQGFVFLTRSLEAGGKGGARQDPGSVPETRMAKKPHAASLAAGTTPRRRPREDSGSGPGPVAESANPDAPGPVAARDVRPRQPDLFDRIEAGPPPPAARPGDFPHGIEIEPYWDPGPEWEGVP